jgi:hypothetical protein
VPSSTRQLAAHPHEYATVQLVGPVIDAVQTAVETKITAFGSAGRSRRFAGYSNGSLSARARRNSPARKLKSDEV